MPRTKVKYENKQRAITKKTGGITKRDHIHQQLLVTKQINVTGMQISNNKRAMMAVNRSPESVSPQNEFYLLYYYCSNL